MFATSHTWDVQYGTGYRSFIVRDYSLHFLDLTSSNAQRRSMRSHLIRETERPVGSACSLRKFIIGLELETDDFTVRLPAARLDCSCC